MTYTPHPAETAPVDGRVIRGWFTTAKVGAAMIAVSWSKKEGAWVDLLGKPLPPGLVLESWGDS